MDTVYKIKFADTDYKREECMKCINMFLDDEPESGCCGFSKSNQDSIIFVRRMKSGNIIAHWQDK